MTDLPKSEGHTCILVAVDRFSKACKLIPLRGLPTSLEIAEQLFSHVFRNYWIPEDIVSDRGPQFISRVWEAFFCLPGVTLSLSSGYHAQTTVHYPELSPDPVCTYLCMLTFQNSYNSSAILIRRLLFFLVPVLHQSCKTLLSSVDS